MQISTIMPTSKLNSNINVSTSAIMLYYIVLLTVFNTMNLLFNITSVPDTPHHPQENYFVFSWLWCNVPSFRIMWQEKYSSLAMVPCMVAKCTYTLINFYSFSWAVLQSNYLFSDHMLNINTQHNLILMCIHILYNINSTSRSEILSNTCYSNVIGW